MRWLVASFLLANLCLAWLVGYLGPPSTQPFRNGDGRLPRVSDLRVESMPLTGDLVQQTISAGAGQTRFCGRITGFGSRRIAQQFADNNGALFDNVTIDAEDSDLDAYFWVIVPPFGDRGEAQDALAPLQHAGVDSYLVTEDEYRLAISLGLFESRSYAQNLNGRFQKQNIETVLVNLPLDRLSYALAFEAGSQMDRLAITSPLKRYSKRLELVKFQPCEGVATSSESP